ncbi:MAG: hypothetical protein LH660_16535 [Phormidesmis sp. CAN_BIN36]|nr:hypothetical protein [Phormidesmis sp. CAN_BIN36]
MKPFFSSRISKFGGSITLCMLSITTFNMPAMADSIRDLQDEVTKRGVPPEDVDKAMRTRFPKSSFPYYEPANGSSKSVCDDKFLVEMSRICESAPSGLDTVCRTAGAVPYYKFVDEFGKKAYDAAQSKQASYIRDVYDWLSTLKVTKFQTNSYINTGISIRSGDKIRIRASGTIIFGRFFVRSGGPNGIIFNPIYKYFSDVPHGRLMARFRQPGMKALDGWAPISEEWDQVREVKLPSSGVLEFLVNDNKPGDNRGKFRIEVTIHSGKQ